jgi:hypothetical protein
LFFAIFLKQQSHEENLMLADKIEEQANTSRVAIPSPISNMMQSDCIDHIYYQYNNSNKYIPNNFNNTNSIKRAQKVSIPTVPITKIASLQDQASQVPLLLTNDIKHIPLYIEHNSIAKEMAV